LTIAIDAKTICAPDGSRGAGIEHFTWSICFHLFKEEKNHDFVVLLPRYAPKGIEDQLEAGGNVRFIRPKLPVVRGLSQHYLAPLRLFLSKVDVLFAPAGQLPIGWKKPAVVYVHDVSIFEHPEWFPDGEADNLSAKKIVPETMNKASHILAASKFTQAQIERIFPVTRGKTSVAYQGVSEILPKKKIFSGGYDTVLFLGTIEPRKNVAAAIIAFDNFLKMHPERASTTKFILAGKEGWKSEETMQLIKKVNSHWNEPVINHLGFVTEQEKWELLSRSSAFLYPSLEEGFGRPVLEAMVAGIPVITTERGAIPEVGGDTVLYIDPEDIEQMSFSLAQCLLVPEGMNEIIESAQNRAKGFTWQHCTKDVLETLNQVKNNRAL